MWGQQAMEKDKQAIVEATRQWMLMLAKEPKGPRKIFLSTAISTNYKD